MRFFWLAALAGGLWLLDSQTRPVIQTMAAYQARVFATQAMNQAVQQVLDRQQLDYESLVQLSYDQQGQVASIQTDMLRLNQLKADITQAVSQRMQLLKTQSVQVPLGTLLGGQLLSGRGPQVEFKILPAGYTLSSIENSFDSAGINQTRHQLLLDVQVGIVAIIPGYTVSTQVNTNFCLAETVIVGTVPEAFTKITGDDRSSTGQAVDHLATPVQ